MEFTVLYLSPAVYDFGSENRAYRKYSHLIADMIIQYTRAFWGKKCGLQGIWTNMVNCRQFVEIISTKTDVDVYSVSPLTRYKSEKSNMTGMTTKRSGL